MRYLQRASIAEPDVNLPYHLVLASFSAIAARGMDALFCIDSDQLNGPLVVFALRQLTEPMEEVRHV
jgi:hypothetical protein